MNNVMQNNEFRKLITAQFFSDLAAWIDTTVVGVLLVYFWHLGVNFLADYTITLVSAFFIGSLASIFFVDRIQPKWIMMNSNILRTLIVIGFIFSNSVPTLFILVFFKYFFTAFYDPAAQKLIKYTVKENDLLTANSICSTMTYGMKIFAPFAGASLLIFYNPHQIFTLCALIFSISSLILIFIKKLPLGNSTDNNYSDFFALNIKLHFRNVIHYFFKCKSLYLTTLFMSIIVFSIFICESYYILLLHHLGFSDSKSGVLLAFVGVGGVIGAISVKKYFSKCSVFYLMSIAVILTGISILITGILAFEFLKDLHVIIIPILFFVVGFANAMLFIPYITNIQKATEHHLIGGITSISSAILTLFMVVGPLLGSYLIQAYGLGKLFILDGIFCISLGFMLLIIFLKLIRKELL